MIEQCAHSVSATLNASEILLEISLHALFFAILILNSEIGFVNISYYENSRKLTSVKGLVFEIEPEEGRRKNKKKSSFQTVDSISKNLCDEV